MNGHRAVVRVDAAHHAERDDVARSAGRADLGQTLADVVDAGHAVVSLRCRRLALLTRTQLAQRVVAVDAGVVLVAPLDADGVASDDADLHRIELARRAEHRQQAPRLAFAAAGARAVLAQIAVRVDAAVAVVPDDLDAVLAEPLDRLSASRPALTAQGMQAERNGAASEKQRDAARRASVCATHGAPLCALTHRGFSHYLPGNDARTVREHIRERLGRARRSLRPTLPLAEALERVEARLGGAAALARAAAHRHLDLPDRLRRQTRAARRHRPRSSAPAAGRSMDEIVDVATALELIHSATLLHDDIIDNSEIRRGKDSAFRKYGLANTLVTGDFVFSRAFQLCARFEEKLINWAAEACISLTEGEIMQGRFRNNPAVTLDDYLEIISRKTASHLPARGAHRGVSGARAGARSSMPWRSAASTSA